MDASRFRVLIVEDEFWENLITRFAVAGVIALPWAGVGALATNGPGDSWTNRLYNEEHRKWESQESKEDPSLLDVCVGGADAVARFKEDPTPYDAVVLDVDLHAFTNSAGEPLSNFEGLTFYRNMAEFASRIGRAAETLFILYTRSPAVVGSLGALLVTSGDDLRTLRDVCRPLIVTFGAEQGNNAMGPVEGGRNGFSQALLARNGTGDLLLGLVEGHLEGRAVRTLRGSQAFTDVIKTLDEMLGVASLSEFSRKRMGKLWIRAWEGRTFPNWFPFSAARLRSASGDLSEARAECQKLRDLLTASFRTRLARLWRVINALEALEDGPHGREARYDGQNGFEKQPLRHFVRIGGGALPAAFADLITELNRFHSGDGHDRFDKAVHNPLLQAAETGQTVKVVALLEELCKGIFGTPNQAQNLVNKQLGSNGLAWPWAMWQADYDAIVSVMVANAEKHCENNAALQIEVAQVNQELVVSCWTGSVPADPAAVVMACKAAPTPAKLSELKWIVCDLYDGWFEVVSKPAGGTRKTKAVAVRRTGPSEPEDYSGSAEQGTTYRLHFPIGL